MRPVDVLISLFRVADFLAFDVKVLLDSDIWKTIDVSIFQRFSVKIKCHHCRFVFAIQNQAGFNADLVLARNSSSLLRFWDFSLSRPPKFGLFTVKARANQNTLWTVRICKCTRRFRRLDAFVQYICDDSNHCYCTILYSSFLCSFLHLRQIVVSSLISAISAVFAPIFKILPPVNSVNSLSKNFLCIFFKMLKSFPVIIDIRFGIVLVPMLSAREIVCFQLSILERVLSPIWLHIAYCKSKVFWRLCQLLSLQICIVKQNTVRIFYNFEYSVGTSGYTILRYTYYKVVL